MSQRNQRAAWVSLMVVVATGVCGCAPERPESVPADAKSIAKQSGSNPVNFTAPDDGSIYVYDRSEKKMVYSGRLKEGETVEVDPRRDKVRVDGRVVLEKQLRDLNEYQVWFDQEPAAQPAATKTNTTRVEVQMVSPEQVQTQRPAPVQPAKPAAPQPAKSVEVQTNQPVEVQTDKPVEVQPAKPVAE